MTRFELPPVCGLPVDRVAAMRRQLAAEIARRPRRKPILIAASAAVAAAAATAGGYAYVQHPAPVTDKSEARCYTVASLSDGAESFTFVAEAAVAGQPGPGPSQVDNALSVCAGFWRQGILRPGPDGARGAPDPGRDHPVPPLVACVLPDGTAAVFPGTTPTCAALGLPNAAG